MRILASLALAFLSAAVSGAGQYRIIDLGTLGGPRSGAVAINDRGQVAGTSWTEDKSYYSGFHHAFLWEDGEMTDLGRMGGWGPGYSEATAMNERGEIVGTTPEAAAVLWLWQEGITTTLATNMEGRANAINDSGQVVGVVNGRAFLWENGVIKDLGTLGWSNSAATAINDSGQVVGKTETGSQGHAFLWEDGLMTDLGTLGGTTSEAVAINERGQIVGTASTAEGASHAFLWEDGLMTDLGSLGGTWSEAVAINEGGQIVGTAGTAEGASHAFLWEDGLMTDLGTLGGTTSEAVAINERRQIVGTANTPEGDDHAFLWENGVMTDLGTLSGQHSSAAAINERGQIVGTSDTTELIEHWDGDVRDPWFWNEAGCHAVLWNPSPVITGLGTSSEGGVTIGFTGVPATSLTTYYLASADAVNGPWSEVNDAVLTELEPDRYQFTLPVNEARAGSFWRVIEAEPGDSDGDQVSDAFDACPGHDDREDRDIDQVPDACDLCPGYDDRIDQNSNGVPDACDRGPTLILPGGVLLELVRIPAGTFQMGSPDTERSRDSDEGPMHAVTIGHDYYLGKHEVTQGQWKALMGGYPGAGPSFPYGVDEGDPVYCVSWNDAQRCVAALNAHIAATGQVPLTMRMPSEAEWEYACRAGTQTRFSFGDSVDVADLCQDDGVRGQCMWYCGNNASYGTNYGTKRVGTKTANSFGLSDMHGNVWEWCEDSYRPDYAGAPTDGSAWGPLLYHEGHERVIRGGYWGGDALVCRSAARTGAAPSNRSIVVGFRVAATAPDPEALVSLQSGRDTAKASDQTRTRPQQLMTGLAAYYSFDIDARDDLGAQDGGYTGQPTPVVTTADKEMGRGAMDFLLGESESNGTVLVPHIGIENVFTVSLWLNRTGGGSYTFGSRDDRHKLEGRSSWSSSSTVNFACNYARLRRTGRGSEERQVWVRASRGMWHNVVLRIDEIEEGGRVQDGTIAIFLDGKLKQSENTVYGYPLPTESCQSCGWPNGENHNPFSLQYPLGIGGYVVAGCGTAEPSCAARRGYVGRIDEVALWSRALTDEEIGYLYDWEWNYAEGKDADGDGFVAGVDCDDARADVRPGGEYVVYRASGLEEAWSEVVQVQARGPVSEWREPLQDAGFYRVEERWYGPVSSRISFDQEEIVLRWGSTPPAEDAPGDGIDQDCGAGLAIETAPSESGPWTAAQDVVIAQRSLGRFVATLRGSSDREHVRVVDPDLAYCILSVERSADGMLTVELSSPSVDSDWDEVPDCHDLCEGADDRMDGDGDGTPDFADGCPSDPRKTEPGMCGCGRADSDSDDDGVPDCNDGCPDNPFLLEPGECGCHAADLDLDGDGAPDCRSDLWIDEGFWPVSDPTNPDLSGLSAGSEAAHRAQIDYARSQVLSVEVQNRMGGGGSLTSVLIRGGFVGSVNGLVTGLIDVSGTRYTYWSSGLSYGSGLDQDTEAVVLRACGGAVVGVLMGGIYYPVSRAGVSTPRLQILSSETAAETNSRFPNYVNAPYGGLCTRELATMSEGTFLQVRSSTNLMRSSRWFGRYGLMAGGPSTISQQAALPYSPAYIRAVRVGSGSVLRAGRVGAQPDFGHPNAGGFQYELLRGAWREGQCVPLRYSFPHGALSPSGSGGD